jgi:hypothetical protein
MKFKSTVLTVTLFGMMFTGLSFQAQMFKVSVLNALNGTPFKGVKVFYICEGQYFDPSKWFMTDTNGIAEIPYVCRDTRVKIDLGTGSDTIWDSKVEECGDLTYQTLQQILDIGIISNPTAEGGLWCPAKISKKMKPIPGQVIIFVKKPTWYQKNIAP